MASPPHECYTQTHVHQYYLGLNDLFDVLQSLAVFGGIKDLIKLLLQHLPFTEGPGGREVRGEGREGDGREERVRRKRLAKVPRGAGKVTKQLSQFKPPTQSTITITYVYSNT